MKHAKKWLPYFEDHAFSAEFYDDIVAQCCDSRNIIALVVFLLKLGNVMQSIVAFTSQHPRPSPLLWLLTRNESHQTPRARHYSCRVVRRQSFGVPSSGGVSFYLVIHNISFVKVGEFRCGDNPVFFAMLAIGWPCVTFSRGKRKGHMGSNLHAFLDSQIGSREVPHRSDGQWGSFSWEVQPWVEHWTGQDHP